MNGSSPTAASATRRSAEAAQVVAVAYSGGRDSTALLHATLASIAGYGQRIRVVALHVHHGLSPHADAWAAHCQTCCDEWSKKGWPIELEVRRLTGRPKQGDSVEAWARDERYRALREMALAHGADVVLLAHHRRDQAETLLLQALRGAGLSGLAGMPRSVLREGVTWLRPWLNQSRDSIDAYVEQHALVHIDDDSNTDTRFARNRLRLTVWPTLLAAFPQLEPALAASAAWAAEAADGLDELARMDLGESGADVLDVKAWLGLSPARRSNSLRLWLKRCTGTPATASLVLRLASELPTCVSGSRWPIAGGELRCHRQQLRFVANAVEAIRPVRETGLSVRRAGTHALPGWGGRLQIARIEAGGVPLAWLAQIELRPRLGAEQFQAGASRPPRSLKKQFQSANVPAWERSGPLVYSGGQLIYVPGLGIDARAVGLPGQPLMSLRWLPLSPA